MCGRFVLATPVDQLAGFFDARVEPAVSIDRAPSWNIAPTTEVLGVRTGRGGGRLLDVFRWGLIPAWAGEPTIGNRAFNARAETVATKPLFRSAFQSHRIVLPADGYWEWPTAPGNHRQPFFFQRTDGAPIAFAGLGETWHDARLGDGPDSWIRSCAIITTDANPDVAGVHHRMPVILHESVLEAWLDHRRPDHDELEALLRPAPVGTLIGHPVDRRVGDVHNDDPGLLEPIPLEDVNVPSTTQELQLFPVSDFYQSTPSRP